MHPLTIRSPARCPYHHCTTQDRRPSRPHTHKHTRGPPCPETSDGVFCGAICDLLRNRTHVHTNMRTHRARNLCLFPRLSLISCPVSANVHTHTPTRQKSLWKFSVRAAGDRKVNNVFNHTSMTPILTNTHKHAHTDSYLSVPQRPTRGCPNPVSIATGESVCVCVRHMGLCE